ncbi:MAG: aspartyl/asparaginyl beta-hydroxylase domain-containing protein [Sphingomicrobium sp.]
MNTDLLARADAAAASGQMYEALGLLQQVIDAGGAEFETLLKAASLYRANAEPRKALAIIDQALAMEPLHFFALFMRAWMLDQVGALGAAEAYGVALAQRGSTAVPPAMEPVIARAEQLFAQYKSTSSAKLEEAIAPALEGATALEQARIKRFVSNNARLTRTFHCEPTDFYFPGLAEYEFHERSFFPWLAEIEDATSVIRGELLAVMAAEGAELVPYVQYQDQIPMRQFKPLNHNLDWTAIHLLQHGRVIEKNAAMCPRTMELLARVPRPDIPGVAPNAMFSLLKPHTLIPPHNGIANFRLVCHLPLIVPDKCWFRVGSDTRPWTEGELIIFDDSIEHEASNDSDELRVVLIFDIWHHGLSDVEKQGITAALASAPPLTGSL